MTRSEILYKPNNGLDTKPFHMEGRMHIRGIGYCEIESQPGSDKSVTISMMSSLIDPRNIRRISTLQPGQSFTIVRPTASLTISNLQE